MYALHYASTVTLNAPIDIVFSYLDDFKKLSAHMEQSSGMMMGSKMTIDMDAREGRVVGSKIRLHGKMMGMTLSLEEVVIERQPPLRKVWETINVKLLVIGQYRLGFELTPKGSATNVQMFIDYDLPEKPPARWLGRLFGKIYARWCTESMRKDAVKHFEQVEHESYKSQVPRPLSR
jgi:uncharacterized membrane protein